MILTIAQYIEALGGGDGRFRTLERLRAVPDESGAPRFTMPGHGLADFEVVAGDVPYTLRCPLRHDAEATARLHTLGERDRGLGSRFFTEWSLLGREIVLFDGTGNVVEVDILIRPTPAGEPLADFLQKAVARGDSAALTAACRSFEELTGWTRSVGRSGIVARRLLVTGDGGMVVTGFSANDRTSLIAEQLRAAAAGEPVPGITAEGVREKGAHGYGLDGEGEIRCVRDGGGWMYVDRRGHAVIDAVWTAAAPFRKGRAEVETRSGKGLIDLAGRAVLDPVYEELAWDEYWGVAAVMAEGAWSLVDRNGAVLTPEPYDWLGECSEGFVLAQKGGKCGFIDTDGREAIPFIYDDASSFSEGCALVTAGDASFFVDSKGRKI